jgi:DNA-directed RNA polymerase subunit M/transcription elongation factor TFIIS
MVTPIATVVCQDLGERALLVPFIKRDTLFESSRMEMLSKIRDKIAADKKIFDTEHDRSQDESDFQCPFCKSFKTKQYPLQMRSADEPMAILWTCFACNKSGVEK